MLNGNKAKCNTKKGYESMWNYRFNTWDDVRLMCGYSRHNDAVGVTHTFLRTYWALGGCK